MQQTARYSWVEGYLFYTELDLEIRCCVREDEIHDILKACQDRPCRGHFVNKRIRYKVLRMGYVWHTLFQDTTDLLVGPTIEVLAKDAIVGADIGLLVGSCYRSLNQSCYSQGFYRCPS